MINCTIIIVNYNTGEILNQVVSNIINCAIVEKVIVVDNCSVDNSIAMLKTHDKLQVYLRNYNHGFAKSCNYGAKYSNSDYLLFLNPDCYIENTGLERLVEELKKNSNAGIIGCMIKNPDGSEQRASRRRLPTLLRAIKTFTGIEKLVKFSHYFAGVNLSHEVLKHQTYNVEAISGALILIKSKLFKEINGFDEDFPLHFEDLDLFKRCIENGYSILFNPIVEAVHYQGTSSQSNPAVEQFKKIGLQLYFYKHCSYFSYLIIKMINKLLWTKQ